MIFQVPIHDCLASASHAEWFRFSLSRNGVCVMVDPSLISKSMTIFCLGGCHPVSPQIARFSNQWKDYLENPYNMVIDL